MQLSPKIHLEVTFVIGRLANRMTSSLRSSLGVQQ